MTFFYPSAHLVCVYTNNIKKAQWKSQNNATKKLDGGKVELRLMLQGNLPGLDEKRENVV